MNESYKHIDLVIEDNIASLIFNRPDQLNSMNREMMDEIIAAIESINANADARVAIIKGRGRAFMAGADIKEYGAQTEHEFNSFQARGELLYASIEAATKPWIAAVNGFALGGGFEIPLACDLIVASQTAQLGLPEVFLNLVPGGGGTQRLIQKVGLNRAKEMLFTGGKYDAETLHQWGVVNHVFPDDDFDQAVYSYALKLTRRPAGALAELKRLAQLSATPLPFGEKISEERRTVSELFHGPEAKQAIQDFIDKA